MVWCQPARSPSWQDSGMERVLGIGGYFLRAADPPVLAAWYRDCLGLDADENGLWHPGAGLTVFATFDSETDYFGSCVSLSTSAPLACNCASIASRSRTRKLSMVCWAQDPK